MPPRVIDTDICIIGSGITAALIALIDSGKGGQPTGGAVEGKPS